MPEMLFKQQTRDERQEEARVKWIKSKCKGTFEFATGFGKTWTAIKCIKSVLNKYRDLRVLVVVPTDNLRIQWIQHLDNNQLSLNSSVQIVNTVIKRKWKCDILIIDEAHRYASDTFQEIFNTVEYRYILGLTATFERLDGKHEIIAKYCPVIDRVTTEHFEFFNYDFGLAMSMIGKDGFRNRAKYRDAICKPGASEEERKHAFRMITIHAIGFIRTIQQRKAFINNHPKKLEIARKIIEARPGAKIITFSSNVKMAESIGYGVVYTGKNSSKKKNRITLEEFERQESGVINSCVKLNEGADIKGLSVAIILGLDSSETKSIQRRGRTIRKEGDKLAEIFNIVIDQTIETKWFANSHKNSPFITIDENGLDAVLRGDEPKPYVKKIKDFTFRY